MKLIKDFEPSIESVKEVVEVYERDKNSCVPIHEVMDAIKAVAERFKATK